MDIGKRIEELKAEIEFNVNAMEGSSLSEFKRLFDLTIPLRYELLQLIEELLNKRMEEK